MFGLEHGAGGNARRLGKTRWHDRATLQTHGGVEVRGEREVIHCNKLLWHEAACDWHYSVCELGMAGCMGTDPLHSPEQTGASTGQRWQACPVLSQAPAGTAASPTVRPVRPAAGDALSWDQKYYIQVATHPPDIDEASPGHQ